MSIYGLPEKQLDLAGSSVIGCIAQKMRKKQHN